jgi:hypothetical protein
LREAAGRRPYLCSEDEDALVRIIVDAQQNLIPITIPRLLKEAQRMKEARHQAPVHFLTACRSVDLLAKFPVGDVDCPLHFLSGTLLMSWFRISETTVDDPIFDRWRSLSTQSRLPFPAVA